MFFIIVRYIRNSYGMGGVHLSSFCKFHFLCIAIHINVEHLHYNYIIHSILSVNDICNTGASMHLYCTHVLAKINGIRVSQPVCTHAVYIKTSLSFFYVLELEIHNEHDDLRVRNCFTAFNPSSVWRGYAER